VRARFAFRLRDGDADDLDILLRFLFITLCILDLVHNVHAADRAAEDGVLAIEPGLFKLSA
jgi:hypothetical protein